eukprot:Nitzschia sp. Nitz4//scaffold176_size46146//4706//5305//NITZ4_007187-RA/size46146-processed-gene-0.50-mRNA-1//1//CDS//3329539000//6396//frame0
MTIKTEFELILVHVSDFEAPSHLVDGDIESILEMGGLAGTPDDSYSLNSISTSSFDDNSCSSDLDSQAGLDDEPFASSQRLEELLERLEGEMGSSRRVGIRRSSSIPDDDDNDSVALARSRGVRSRRRREFLDTPLLEDSLRLNRTRVSRCWDESESGEGDMESSHGDVFDEDKVMFVPLTSLPRTMNTRKSLNRATSH